MEQIFALIVKALGSQQASDILISIGVYVVVPITAHIHVEFIKYDRLRRGLPDLGRWTIRGIAFIITFAMATFMAWRVGGWPADIAMNHAVNIAMMYPGAMWAYKAWLRKKSPDAYTRLSPPRRRKGDNDKDKEHSSTWDGNQ